jgi:hypothetical protein
VSPRRCSRPSSGCRSRRRRSVRSTARPWPRARRSRSRSSTPTSRRSSATICGRSSGSSASSSGSCRTKGLEDVYREIRAIVLAELDFRAEADNGDRIAANFTDRKDVAFPQVVRDRSTARVLTTRFETGVKISDAIGCKQLGLDRRALARQVVEVYCQQIFTDGVYHADPHPGNLLVRPAAAGDGAELVFLDFGAVATISPQFRAGIIELVQGGLTRDTRRIVRAMRQMGFVARGADDRVFEQGHRVLPRSLQREHLARHPEPEGPEARSREDPREEPREPGRPAQDGHLAARAV